MFQRCKIIRLYRIVFFHWNGLITVNEILQFEAVNVIYRCTTTTDQWPLGHSISNDWCRMRKMRQSDWNMCVCQSFYDKCKWTHKTLFLEQHITIVNRVTLQSFWFIFTCIKYTLPGLVHIFVYNDSHLSLNQLYCTSCRTFVCLFVWFDSLRPINNLSVKQGRVFLGWTSTKLR